MADPPASPDPKSPTDFPPAADVSSPGPEPSVGAGSTVIGTVPDTDHPAAPIGLGIGDSNKTGAATTTSNNNTTQIPFGLGLSNIGSGLSPTSPLLKPLDTTITNTNTIDLSLASPAGLPIPQPNHENLLIFRRAVGINTTVSGSGSAGTDPRSLEEGRRKAVGIYAVALGEVRRKKFMYHFLSFMINAGHVAQIIIGASLTAL